MIERLMRGYDRAGQFLTDLRIMGTTLAELALFRIRRTTVTQYPLRCRHCARSIRVANHPSAVALGRAMYRAADGSYSCDGTILMHHEPMLKIR